MDTGQRNLGMGLMDYHARFYSPSLGRFTQPDSIIPDLTNSQAWNRFSYVLNSPINFNDPTGHESFCGHANSDPECEEAEDPPATSPSGGGPGGSGNDDRDDLEEELKLLEVVKDVTSNETLWPDNWFEYYCPYITSCVGQYVKYYTFSFGTAIPNPLTGTIVGWHIAFTLDQYGDWFFGIGIDAGKNVLGVSASLVEGRFANDQLPSNDIAEQRFLRSYLTGNSFQGFLVPIFYIGANYSPSVGEFSAEDGVGIPQGGVAWTHSWLISGGQ